MLKGFVKFVTGTTTVNDGNHRVRTQFNNAETASKMLSDLNTMIEAVIQHMVAVNLDARGVSRTPQFNPARAIDELGSNPLARAQIVAKNLRARYDSNQLIENNPSGTKNTSYVMKKGLLMAICLREKQSGKNTLHDMPILQFVALHELAHVGTLSKGHEPGFWKNFKAILQAAAAIGYILPDYQPSAPVNYCGITVTYNPYYSDTLSLEIIDANDI